MRNKIIEFNLKANIEAENERLPVELGWAKSEQVVSLADITLLTLMIRNATNLITPSKSGAAVGRRDLHGGGH